ncbi:hypothetical protein KJ567_04950 [Candidatus Bipolaricaulota bacterium]|nr:hypothetical protein [Candidatus Bipolaricaulota bacterium]
MNRALQILTLIVLVGLLAGVLFVLVDISQNGILLELAGSVDVTGMSDQVELTMGQPVTLVLEEPANLSVSGPDGGALPATLSLLPCPECGAPMLPVRWNPWTGKIDWVCTGCGERVSQPAAP